MPDVTREPWQIDTGKLAEQILEAKQASRTEEDLKMRVEPLIKRAFTSLGIAADIVEYERATGLRSRIDALYGFLVIEYEGPGKLGTRAGLREGLRQTQDYMGKEAERFGKDPAAMEKFIGVCLDGERIAFVRFSRSAQQPPPVPLLGMISPTLFPDLPGFQILGPFPVNAESITAFLIYARAAGRRPLTAEDLAKAFGPGTDVAQEALSTFYTAVKRIERQATATRPKRFFNEWDRLFGVVYGQDIGRAEKTAEETARLYKLPGGADLKPLLFSIHTYYAILMKLIAIELLALQPKSALRGFASELPHLKDAALRDRLAHLESGYEFSALGIENFLEADFFQWYLDLWNPQVARILREVARTLTEFEPATPALEPHWTQDLLRNLYEIIVPQKLRHDLGEYYTPDWLAQHLLDRVGYDGSPDTRFLDPACGSGTFLVHALKRALTAARSRPGFDPARDGKKIIKNIVGFDLNPMAVLAARTNYLINIAEIIPHVCPISLPVYLCDSVVPLERPPDPDKPLFSEGTVVFSTHERNYEFPLAMKEQARIDKFTGEVDTCLRAKLSVEAFRRKMEREFKLPERDTEKLATVYRQIKELHDAGQNGIWARYIKNAFAPEYVGRFDFVVGNPPWIRWRFLSDEYRRRTLHLWHRYGIFSLKGHEARLGAGEKDFSMLFTYACADRYLKDDGLLGFLITETVFKARGGGEGFRRFHIPQTNTPLKVLFMEDMVSLNPFLTASNRTCLFGLRKGERTRYPVSVIHWRRYHGIGRIPPDLTITEVLSKTERKELKAIPVDPQRPESAWQTAAPAALRVFHQMKGVNPYQARLGAYTAPYGVFRLALKQTRPDGLIIISNLTHLGEKEVRPVSSAIESKLVFPAVNGPEITRFGFKDPFYILLVQDPATRNAYDVEWMQTNVPMTYAYLKQFENVLKSRAIIAREPDGKWPFYAMYNVGPYTVAPYRVTWARTTSRMSAVVLSKVRTQFGRKEVIGCDDTTFIPTNNREEAHYLCAIMNSTPVREFLYAAKPSAHVGPPSAVKPLAIPSFSSKARSHRQLKALSMEAHRRVARGRPIKDLDAQIDELVRKLWNIES